MALNGRSHHLGAEPALPISDVADRLAPWIVAASRPLADWYFGEPEVADEIVREWMLRPSSELFVGRAIVAHDGEGAATGASSPWGAVTWRAAGWPTSKRSAARWERDSTRCSRRRRGVT